MPSVRGKLWQVVSLLLLVSLIATACVPAEGGDQAPPPAQQPGVGAATPAGPAGTPAAGAAQPGAATRGHQLNPDVSGNVEFWHFWASPVRRNAVRRVIAICQQQLPNIRVTDTVKPFGDIWTANLAAVAAGSGMPDVIVEDRPKLPQMARDNVESNLGELARRDGIDGSSYWPFTWEQTLYEDDPYGLPFETDVRVLFYSRTAFEEVGLDPDRPPTTWEELWEYADRLDRQNPNGSYDRIGFFPMWNAGPDIWGFTNSVNWVDDEGRPEVNSDGAVETIEWIKRWIDRYGGWQNLVNFRAQFAAPPNDAFMSGRVAMIVDIAGYSSQLNFYRPRVRNAEGQDVNMDWGVSDTPYNTELGMWSGGFALSIPRGARNTEAAWEFIKCATRPEAQASWARDTYAIPANMEAARDPVLMADPAWQSFIEAMEYSSGGVFVPEYPNYFEQVNQRLERVWLGQVEPRQAMDEAQQAIEGQMNR
jgi:multiple sugar transport system substrate-binding protein